MRYFQPIRQSPEKRDILIMILKYFAKSSPFIDDILIYGSYCRNSWHCYSDLDTRVIANPNFIDKIIGAIICLTIRLISVLLLFPIDIYLVVDSSELLRLSKDETPVRVSNINLTVI